MVRRPNWVVMGSLSCLAALAGSLTGTE
jgi:hypothetical protein